MEPFCYTTHIHKRMRQRGLIREQIEDTVVNPDALRQTYRGRYLAQKRFHGKILEVVYRKANGHIVLITAYWLEGSQRP